MAAVVRRDLLRARHPGRRRAGPGSRRGRRDRLGAAALTALLLSLGAVVLLAAVLIAGLCALTLLPFVTALGLAERRGLGTTRWGLAAALCSAIGLGIALVALRHGLGPVALGFSAVATWAAPLALLALGDAGGSLAGLRGRHE